MHKMGRISIFCSYVAIGLFQICFGIVTHQTVSVSVTTSDNTQPWMTSQRPLRNIQYRTSYFQQPVDHFGYANSDTFQQRYLVADQFWDPADGPVFFYTGNEGDIAWFCNNTGLMWDWAPEFKALLIFAEHRYYGKSLPYGKDSYQDLSKLGYLTSEQALADFTELITHLKQTVPGMSDKPVIAFGGSYGGMLAAWFRIKYPHVVQGALAASAPIWQFGDLVPCEGFYETVTKDFQRSSVNCAENIRKSWAIITSAGQTETGREALQKTFSLCKPLESVADVTALKVWLSGAYTYLAMVDYPYEANFIEPLPAWPIDVVCEPLKEAQLSGPELLVRLSQAMKVYYNYTGGSQCLDIAQGASSDLGDLGWGFQACTEMVMPMCADGESDMFEPAPWDYAAYVEGCRRTWGATPRPQWILEQYGGKHIDAATNIIFSNGELDPWKVGGVLSSLSPTLVALLVPEGAHHLDLRGANPHDPPGVISVREQEKEIISGWIQRHARQDAQLQSKEVVYSPSGSYLDCKDTDVNIGDAAASQGWTVTIGTLVCFLSVGGLALVYMYLVLCESVPQPIYDIQTSKASQSLGSDIPRTEAFETKIAI